MKQGGHARTARRAALILIGGILMLTLFGCGQKYRVDYCGQKACYSGARDAYRAGAQVELVFGEFATDTDYRFFLDGESFQPEYDEKKGFVLRFTMPAHDVTVRYESRNSMEYIPETDPEEENALLVNYYYAVGTADGDDVYELALYARPDGAYLLEEYRSDGEEARYDVPEEAWTRCRAAIRDGGFSTWADLEDADCLDGTRTVCRYREGDEMIRVSTDQMPPDGEARLDAIRSILQTYCTEQYAAD